MTTIDSSSAPESSMEEGSNGPQTLTNKLRSRTSSVAARRNCGGDADDEEEKSEVWETFSKSFSQVQSVLDRNRALIKQVNENHQSRVSDNLVKNVALIQELNKNISKVASLYSDLSSNFSTMIHPRGAGTGREGDGKEGAAGLDAGAD